MKKLTIQIAVVLLSASIALAYGITCLAPLINRPITESITPLPDDQDNKPALPEQESPPEANPDTPAITPDPAPAPEPQPEPEAKASYVRSKVDGLNLRSGPGTSYSSVGHINKGDMVALLGKEGNWYKTQYKNSEAYISAGEAFTEIMTMDLHSNESVEKVIDEGLRLLGFPYVYGAIRLHDGSGRKISGFNPREYDCSSLMQYMFYYGANINLNMTTRTQVKQGNFVAKSEISRGDLIFFTNAQRYNKTGIERIGHVALYLGDNYILHTATDYAVIEEISATRWGYYIETRRLI